MNSSEMMSNILYKNFFIQGFYKRISKLPPAALVNQEYCGHGPEQLHTAKQHSAHTLVQGGASALKKLNIVENQFDLSKDYRKDLSKTTSYSRLIQSCNII